MRRSAARVSWPRPLLQRKDSLPWSAFWRAPKDCSSWGSFQLSALSSCLSGNRFQIEIRNLQGGVDRVEVGSIAENNHGQVIRRKALDGSAKANRLTIVPHPLAPLVGLEKPTKAVADGMAILLCRPAGWLHRRQGGLHFFLAQQGMVLQSVIPAGHIVD